MDIPLLANMTEFGKSELLTVSQLADIGYNVVIYPVTTLRLAMFAVEDGLREIESTGNTIRPAGSHAAPQAALRVAALRRLQPVRRRDLQLGKGPNQ